TSMLKLVFAAAMCAGCRHSIAESDTTRPAATTRAAAADDKTFDDDRDHFRLSYPSSWTARKVPENVLTIDAVANDPAGPEISFAVPHLGPHVPGMIPLPAVEKGYLDDLKKRLKNV